MNSYFKTFSLLILSFAAFYFYSCNKEVEFAFDKNDLIDTPWGIPQIIEPGMGDIDLSAPTIFYSDGHMTIGSDYIDFWSIRDSRTILIEQAGELWFVIRLNPDTLYVEKTKYPGGTFIVKCMYFPMDDYY
ncbi:MAG: hypothetical protein KGZ97_09590 [Bacteroidetes bacterium]|nr:hypothetical protein [Bacteroidota bacterium]